MKDLSKIRNKIVQKLWCYYQQSLPQLSKIEQALNNINANQINLDHVAIIDLPSSNSGVSVLKQLFSSLGFEYRGNGYLPEKHNDFSWLAEEGIEKKLASHALPQIVIADFRLHELPAHVFEIIQKYTRYITPPPYEKMATAVNEEEIANIVVDYLTSRPWPLPTTKEFEAVNAVNELLAWVLISGRKPNHFGLGIYLMPGFNNLVEFNQLVEHALNIKLNKREQSIKGGPHCGIAQSSTEGDLQDVELSDGSVMLRDSFIEFVWRYPKNSETTPQYWQDYFNDFIGSNANKVIESLYTN